MKLTILGGGGVRMPAFVRAVLTGRPGVFEEIRLLEPDPLRRETTARLAVEVAAVLGRPGTVTVTADPARALSGADYVFSAIRVGGDRGRVIDEQVALRRGIVGQETTGAGGCAMALRTIPVVLGYCDLIRAHAPGAVLINFTNPAGLITQAITAHGGVRAVGVCDTPSSMIEQLAAFAGADPGAVRAGYAGLNHLGWVTSLESGGTDLLPGLLSRFDEVRRFDHRLAGLDPALVRRIGAIPTEYVYYYYDERRYLDGVARAGSSRGEDVERLNEELLAAVGRAFASGDVRAAWAAYAGLLGVRHDTYMRTDTEGDNGQRTARSAAAPPPIEPARQDGPAAEDPTGLGGYERLALRVIDGLSGRAPVTAIVNVPNQGRVGYLDPGDVAEVTARLDAAGGIGVEPAPDLPRSAQALVLAVKEYERGVIDAALSGSADLAAVALSLHPLVPGISAARQLIADYRDGHREHLAYLR